MKFVFTTQFLRPTGGVELQMYEVSRELAKRGHDIHILFNEDGELREEYEAFCRSLTQVTTFWFDRQHRLRGLRNLAPAIWAAIRARPDVMYVNNDSELTLGVIVGRLTGAAVLGQLHGFIFSQEEIRASSIPRLANRCHRLMAVANPTRDHYIASGVDPAKIETVHNGVPLSNYRPASAEQRAQARRDLNLPEDAFVATFLGRLDPVKGVEVLLEAWRRLGLPPERARLVIVGSASEWAGSPEARERELHALAPPGCTWLPNRRDVLTPLHATDVLVIPSLAEPFGRVVVEGLATGVPVVASRVGGIPEILQGDLSFLLVECGSSDELAERLSSLMDWRSTMPHLGEQSVRGAAPFSIETMVDNIERIVSEKK
jgi:glycosyltransferase involved in cell wall biosynthesis